MTFVPPAIVPAVSGLVIALLSTPSIVIILTDGASWLLRTRRTTGRVHGGLDTLEGPNE